MGMLDSSPMFFPSLSLSKDFKNVCFGLVFLGEYPVMHIKKQINCILIY